VPSQRAVDKKRKDRVTVEGSLTDERDPTIDAKFLKDFLGLLDLFLDERGISPSKHRKQDPWDELLSAVLAGQYDIHLYEIAHSETVEGHAIEFRISPFSVGIN
jgi:hypothetical protein